MGCTQSKVENEETTRCKERKLFMSSAVAARNAFAAAHSSYQMALKNTGAALSDYAHGEVVPFPSSGTDSTSSAALPSSSGVVQPSYDDLPPPPPPLPDVAPPPLQRAHTMPEFTIAQQDLKPHSDPIIEEEDEEDEIEAAAAETENLRHRTTRSAGGVRSRMNSNRDDVEDEGLTAPPSPPRTPPLGTRTQPSPPPGPGMGSTWDYFFSSLDNMPGPTLGDVEENSAEREEIERKLYEEERAKRAEIERKKAEAAAAKAAAAAAAAAAEKADEMPQQPPPPAATGKTVKKVRHMATSVEGGKRAARKSVNLVQVFSELDDCFLKASESAHEVSKMLEANRLHYHSNFADNRGHIDHSARVMRVITWNTSFRGLLNTDDGKDDFDSEEHETHATVLDKMLAWEKKLYDEVKAGEQMKLEYQRKVSSLNKLKKRGTNTEALERTKAAVSHLHTRYIVDMQSMDSTVSEINRLRDEQLYPKLVALVDGLTTMWETMCSHHKSQSEIVEALKYLDISQSPKETTEHHHQRTVQLWMIVQEWHGQLEKLMTHQKEYIKALNNWLKLNLIPIDNNLKEKVSSPPRPQSPPIQALLHAWHDYLEKLPEELAKTAVSNFAAVVDSIVQYQVEEMKLRDKCEDTRKELERRTRQFNDWHRKYMERKTPPDEMNPERAEDKDLVTERKMVVEMVQKRLEEEQEAYQRQCIQVRDKSLTTLRTRLPELFRSMSEFSHACSKMYRNLRSISKPHNSNEAS